MSTTFPSSASSLKVWGAKFTHDYVNRILLNPVLVKSISFGGPIDVDSFTKVLTRCLNLSSLSVSDRSGFIGKLPLPLKLRNVTSVHLGCEANIKDYLHPYSYLSTLKTFKEIFTKVSFPSLQKLAVECIEDSIETQQNSSTSEQSDEEVTLNSFITLLFRMLSFKKSLTELVVRIHKKAEDPTASVTTEGNGINPSQYKREAKELQLRLAHTEHMRKLRLKKLVADTDEELFLLWDAILPRQNTLVTFECLNQTKVWNYFVPIVQANCNSLRKVKLRNLHCSTSKATRIDLTSFECCKRLEELFLSRFCNATHEVCLRLTTNQKETLFLDRISEELPEVVRFKALPSSLKKLHVQGFTVKSQDLMLIPVSSKNLEVLELQLLGFRGVYFWQGLGNINMTRDAEEKNGIGGDGGAGDSRRSKRSRRILAKGSVRNGTGAMVTTMAMAAETGLPKDTSRYGSGVTPAVLRNLLVKLRQLQTLFVEEFVNDRTTLAGDVGLVQALRSVNLIPGDGILKQHGYYGILIDKEEPSCSEQKIRRCDRVYSWTERFNQYRFQNWIDEKLREDQERKIHG